MKRVLLPLLCLALLLSAFPAAADLSPSSAVITVDGVRAAFFSDDGVYLPLMEENGVVYAPVLSLAESLNLTTTSGNVNALAAAGQIRCTSTSGDLVLTVTEDAGEITVTTTGGDHTYTGETFDAKVTVSKLPEGYRVETAESTATATDVTTKAVEATADKLVIPASYRTSSAGR